jgi:UDP-N-acetylglucosamine--N-acetylmuramyl-(pentapeptide) pyrophosphoryl-undecaprenol N-acetylglucosamine transferase
MNREPTKVMIMAGGTGGHVFPALAVAKELQQRGCIVHWLGTQAGIEARIVPANNIPLHLLSISGLRGKKMTSLFLAPWKIFKAVLMAKKIFREFQPNVVLGMGGYVSGPGGIAAWQMGIPLVVHEQNARAGTTNKWLAHFAQKVLSAFPDVLPNAQCIGNPVRQDIVNIPVPEIRLPLQRDHLRLLVLGGSLGAQAINQLVPEALKLLASENPIDVRHQSGEKHWDDTRARYQQAGVSGDVVAFIDDMASALAWADLVICRAGALTVSELSAAGVASLLIPFPFAIDDHQTANGAWLVKQGAAELRQQDALDAHQLAELIMNFSRDRNKILTMAQAARAASKPNSTIECADICLEVANG